MTIESPRLGGRGLNGRMKDIEHLRCGNGDDIASGAPPFWSHYIHTQPRN